MNLSAAFKSAYSGLYSASAPLQFALEASQRELLYRKIKELEHEIFQTTARNKRDGSKYLEAPLASTHLMSYWPMLPNEILFPYKSKYSSVYPLSPQSHGNSLDSLLGRNSEEPGPPGHLEDGLLSAKDPATAPAPSFDPSLKRALDLLPPDIDDVCRANSRERLSLRNKLPPPRGQAKKTRGGKKKR